MLGFIGEEHDCTTQVEDYRLDNAGDYMKLVSSGIGDLSCGANCDCPCNKKNISGLGSLNGNLGPNYGSWPPGPKPIPERWTAPNGTTWARTLLDNKWMYRSSEDSRLYISASNLYDIMGLRKDENTLIPTGRIPGDMDDWKNWKIGGIGAGWVLLGAFGLYSVLKKGR